MEENSIEEDIKILNNVKEYMQENIDKGFSKFIYNELGYDEKCIDIINAIDEILSDYKRVLKENEELHKGINSLMQSRKKWKHRYYKTKNENKVRGEE